MRWTLLVFVVGAGCSDPATRKEPLVTDTSVEHSAVDTAVELRSLRLEPADLKVDVGASWSLRVVVANEEQQLEDVEATLESSDDAVISVDAGGIVTAVGVGRGEILASWDGLTARAQVEVQETGELVIQVIHAVTGEAVADARLVDQDEQVIVDADGRGVLQAPVGEGVWVTAYGPMGADLIQATVTQVVVRDIIIPLRPQAAEEGPSARAGGEVDFSSVLAASTGEKGPSELRAGIAVPSLQKGPLLLDPDALFGDMRTVSAGGVDIVIPENVYDEDFASAWATSVEAGPVGIWSLVGIIPLASLISALDQDLDAFSFLLPHLDGFVHGWSGGHTAVEGETLSVELVPAAFMSERVDVQIPPHPLGFADNDSVQLVALAGHGSEGPAVVGLGQGVDRVTLGRVPLETYGFEGGGSVVGFLELGGPGSGGARILTHGLVSEGEAQLAPWQRPPSLVSFSGEERTFSLDTDEEVTLVRVHIRSRDGRSRDLYLPAGDQEGELDNQGQPMGYGITTWKLLSIQTSEGTYESLLADGGLRSERLKEVVRTSGMVSREFRD